MADKIISINSKTGEEIEYTYMLCSVKSCDGEGRPKLLEAVYNDNTVDIVENPCLITGYLQVNTRYRMVNGKIAYTDRGEGP